MPTVPTVETTLGLLHQRRYGAFNNSDYLAAENSARSVPICSRRTVPTAPEPGRKPNSILARGSSVSSIAGACDVVCAIGFAIATAQGQRHRSEIAQASDPNSAGQGEAQ